MTTMRTAPTTATIAAIPAVGKPPDFFVLSDFDPTDIDPDASDCPEVPMAFVENPTRVAVDKNSTVVLAAVEDPTRVVVVMNTTGVLVVEDPTGAIRAVEERSVVEIAS